MVDLPASITRDESFVTSISGVKNNLASVRDVRLGSNPLRWVLPEAVLRRLLAAALGTYYEICNPFLGFCTKTGPYY